MGQIVAYSKNEAGNYVLEVKPALRFNRKRTTQVAGTDWDEPLSGLFSEDPEGNQVPLLANVIIRYSNAYKPDLFVEQPSTKEETREEDHTRHDIARIPFKG